MPTEADIALQSALVERLRRSGISNVIGITDLWAAYLQGGGDNAEARAVLAATPGVSDVRRSRPTGSIVTFRFDREQVES
jgi:hypothetical protein